MAIIFIIDSLDFLSYQTLARNPIKLASIEHQIHHIAVLVGHFAGIQGCELARVGFRTPQFGNEWGSQVRSYWFFPWLGILSIHRSPTQIGISVWSTPSWKWLYVKKVKTPQNFVIFSNQSIPTATYLLHCCQRPSIQQSKYLK